MREPKARSRRPSGIFDPPSPGPPNTSRKSKKRDFHYLKPRKPDGPKLCRPEKRPWPKRGAKHRRGWIERVPIWKETRLRQRLRSRPKLDVWLRKLFGQCSNPRPLRQAPDEVFFPCNGDHAGYIHHAWNHGRARVGFAVGHGCHRSTG